MTGSIHLCIQAYCDCRVLPFCIQAYCDCRAHLKKKGGSAQICSTAALNPETLNPMFPASTDSETPSPKSQLSQFHCFDHCIQPLPLCDDFTVGLIRRGYQAQNHELVSDGPGFRLRRCILPTLKMQQAPPLRRLHAVLQGVQTLGGLKFVTAPVVLRGILFLGHFHLPLDLVRVHDLSQGHVLSFLSCWLRQPKVGSTVYTSPVRSCGSVSCLPPEARRFATPAVYFTCRVAAGTV